MMRNQRTDNREPRRGDPRPDPAMGRLLLSVDKSAELMPWSAVEQMIAQAPPVRMSMWSRLLATGNHQLRWASAAAASLMVATGLLAVMPAHSDQVGTLVLTSMPSAWDAGSAAFNEVKTEAERRFDLIAAPQSDLFMVVGERDGRDELALAMLGVDDGDAGEFFSDLCLQYPALDAFDAEFVSIDTDRFGSRLNELLYRISHAGGLETMDDATLKTETIKALANSGFSDVRNVEIQRLPDGRIIIKVEASLDVAVERGHMQEELEAAGLSPELLGEDNFQRLLDELAVP